MKKGIIILIVAIAIVLISLLFLKLGDNENKKIDITKTNEKTDLSENDLASQGYVKLDTDDEVFNAIYDTAEFLD